MGGGLPSLSLQAHDSEGGARSHRWSRWRRGVCWFHERNRLCDLARGRPEAPAHWQGRNEGGRQIEALLYRGIYELWMGFHFSPRPCASRPAFNSLAVSACKTASRAFPSRHIRKDEGTSPLRRRGRACRLRCAGPPSSPPRRDRCRRRDGVAGDFAEADDEAGRTFLGGGSEEEAGGPGASRLRESSPLSCRTGGKIQRRGANVPVAVCAR